MSEKLNDIIQSHARCIPETEMRNYISGKLSNPEMHRVEKHVLDCELCSDALEGLQLLEGRKSIRAVEKNVDQMLQEKDKKQPVIIWFRQNSKYVAAAAVIVMAVGAFLLKDALREVSNIAFKEEAEQQDREAHPAEVSETLKEVQADSIRVAPGTVTVTSNGAVANGSGASMPPEVKDEKTNAEGEMITPAPEPVLASKDDNKPVTIVMKDVTYAATEPAASNAEGRQKTEEAKTSAGAAVAPQANAQPETSERSAKFSKKSLSHPAKPSAGTGTDKNKDEFYDVEKKESEAPAVSEYEMARQDSTSLKVRKNNEDVFVIVEEMPEYPGGMEELNDFLRKNIKHPKPGITGMVYVSFIVKADGSVSDIKVIRSISDCKECEEEVLRVLKLMPKWKSGKNAGNPVSVQIQLPVKFNSK